MDYRVRGYASDADGERIRQFLRASRPAGVACGEPWHVCDFDFWRWHYLPNVVERDPSETRIWEDASGEIAAVLNQGDPGVCHLHIASAARSAALDEAMIVAAEETMTAETRDGRRVLWVWSGADADPVREGVFRRRGYEIYDSPHAIEHYGHRALASPIDDVPLPDGFAVRSMGGDEDLPARSLASWRAFHPGESDDECDLSGDWYRNVQRAPTYRRDFDIVVTAPDGAIASFGLFFHDAPSRSAVAVLAGTATEHHRRGLAKAALTEGLRRLREAGATDAYVSWYEPPAGALYESVGLSERAQGRAWRRYFE